MRSRNDLPDSLVLLLLISRFGRNQVQFISAAIMNRIKINNKHAKRNLLLSLLRIYAYNPLSMILGDAELRSSLKEAVVISADDWLSWRSSFDDSIENMLDAAFSSVPSIRSIQSLVDISKKHPLLLLRKLSYMRNLLENDPNTIDNQFVPDNGRIIVGQSLGGPLRAKVNGNMMNLNVYHWGYSYTQHLWSVILDILSAVPNEVLFECALKMGLLDVLDTYVRLIFVQSNLRSNAERLRNLKDKVSEFLAAFKIANPSSYDSWIASTNNGLPTLGATRNVLVVCGFISAKQAVECVQRKFADEPKQIEP